MRSSKLSVKQLVLLLTSYCYLCNQVTFASVKFVNKLGEANLGRDSSVLDSRTVARRRSVIVPALGISELLASQDKLGESQVLAHEYGLLEDDQNGFAINLKKKHHSSEIYILEDKDYPGSLFERYQGVGQVPGISTLPSGDVAIVHRADREWTSRTFNENNTLVDARNAQDNLIKNDTIMILDRDHGGAVTTFGANLFYLPHSIASDEKGNLWVSDVARHQVMRLPSSSLQINEKSGKLVKNSRWLQGNLSYIWPDIVLGEAFVPGSDSLHFCQPSEIAISSNGRLVFIADGYCNKRVMVFTGSGNYLTSFGEREGFNVVHSLTLIEESNLICVADRENSRILCFKAGLDDDIDSIGELMLTINYPLGRVFAILSLSPNHLLVSSNQAGTNRYDLAALNPFTSELKQAWTSSDLLAPHSLAKTSDGQYVYAADISKSAYRKVFKFNIITREDF